MAKAIIVAREGPGGKSYVIDGTRTRVANVVRYYHRCAREMTIERVVQALPHLTPEQVEAALDFYERNRDLVDEEIRREEELAASIRSKGGCLRPSTWTSA